MQNRYSSETGPNPGLNLHPSTSLAGSVILEPPFKTWACTLHEVEGAAFSYVAPASSLHRVRLGRYCSIGDHVTILSQHPTSSLSTSAAFYQHVFDAPFRVAAPLSFPSLSETWIGHDVWIGAGVSIKTGVRIGDGAIVGAGSVVTRDVAPFTVVGGVPARVIRDRFSDARRERIEKMAWWQYNLLGEVLPWSDIDAALDQIDTLVQSGKLMPYHGRRYRVWRDGDKIRARAVGS